MPDRGHARGLGIALVDHPTGACRPRPGSSGCPGSPRRRDAPCATSSDGSRRWRRPTRRRCSSGCPWISRGSAVRRSMPIAGPAGKRRLRTSSPVDQPHLPPNEQRGAQAFEQAAGLDRLDHVLVRAGGERVPDDGLLVVRRDHNDSGLLREGAVLGPADLAHEIHPVLGFISQSVKITSGRFTRAASSATMASSASRTESPRRRRAVRTSGSCGPPSRPSTTSMSSRASAGRSRVMSFRIGPRTSWGGRARCVARAPCRKGANIRFGALRSIGNRRMFNARRLGRRRIVILRVAATA